MENRPAKHGQKPSKNNKNKNGQTGKSKHHTSTTKSKAELEALKAKSSNPPPGKKKPSTNKLKARQRLAKFQNQNQNNQPQSRPETPSSESSSTRAMLDEMIILSDSDSSRSEGSSYTQLSHDNMLLNTAEVEGIIEQIVTDIEDLSDSSDVEGEKEAGDEDEFGEEAANAGIPRYFLENAGPKCFNCGQSGHVLRDCPAGSNIPCHLCGEVGHARNACPSEICFNCSRPGHQSRDCPQKRRRRVFGDETCNRCGQPGHLSRECTKVWRGYVFTRDLPRRHYDFLEELRGLRKRCYNCASISHFGDDCPSARRPNFSVFHLPEYDYLDQVILRVKKPASSSASESKKEEKQVKHHESKSKNDHNQKNASSHSNQKKTSSHNNQKSLLPHNNQKNSSSHNNPKNTSSHGGQKRPHDDQNRKVFMESRGYANEHGHDSPKRHRHSDDDEYDGEPVPFVGYANRTVKVIAKDDSDEEHLRKGSSNRNKPRYRGGYKK